MLNFYSLKLFVILSFLVPINLYAGYDLSLSGIGLFYPSGSSLKLESGYTKLVYGKSGSLLQGFIRPFLTYKTSLVINNIGYGLNISPLLPLEFTYSKEYQKRKYNDFTAFDCQKVSCSVNLITRETFGFNLALAYKKFFYIGRYNWQNIKLDQSFLSFFAEESSSILGRGNNDDLFQHTSLFGYQNNNKDFIGAFILTSKMNKTNESSNIVLATYGKPYNDQIFIVSGIGVMNRYGATNFTALFSAKWSFLKGHFPFH